MGQRDVCGKCGITREKRLRQWNAGTTRRCENRKWACRVHVLRTLPKGDLRGLLNRSCYHSRVPIVQDGTRLYGWRKAIAGVDREGISPPNNGMQRTALRAAADAER